MTDMNIVFTCPKTGDQLGQFSVEKGTAFDLTELAGRVRHSIRSEMITYNYVHIAQEETLIRIAVPGGWLYRHSGDKNMIYVPDNRNSGSYLGATVQQIPIGQESSTPKSGSR